MSDANAIAAELARLAAENARLLERLTEGERRLRLLARGVLRVQEAECSRLSRELHDGAGQSLTALKIGLERLRAEADRLAPDARGRRLTELRDLADEALAEVRQLSHRLRPQMLDELGLLPTLRWLARSLGEGAGIEVRLEVDEAGLAGALDKDLETLVFRIAQESLTNAAKHARTAWARVELSVTGGRLRLRVEDGGAGFDAERALAATEAGHGFGLRGMRDRAQLFGGRLLVRSEPGRGTRVEVEVPLAEAG